MRLNICISEIDVQESTNVMQITGFAKNLETLGIVFYQSQVTETEYDTKKNVLRRPPSTEPR